MTTLLLVRHATTAATGARLGGRTPGVRLDDAGRAQAEAVARRLAPLPVKAVYASPLERTRETAEIIAGPHRRRVRVCEGMVEVEYGTWTDRSLKQVARRKLWPVVQARPSLVRFPRGESIRAMQLRAVDALQELVARHRRDVIAVVSHADVIKAAVAFYLGLPIDLFQRLHVSPGSVTVLRLGEHEQPALLRFNDDGPLEAGTLVPAGRGGGR
ncbi:MAG: histidine phosphatase family protein [Actinobacteria bacterium]|nr:histidine phosphatase family protein [Actinomycetota bacterium]